MKLSKTHSVVFVVAALLAAGFAPVVSIAQTSPQKNGAGQRSSNAARSLPALRSRADFDKMALVYTDGPYALPHVLFVIDRKDKNKIYYVNSQRYRFHK